MTAHGFAGGLRPAMLKAKLNGPPGKPIGGDGDS